MHFEVCFKECFQIRYRAIYRIPGILPRLNSICNLYLGYEVNYSTDWIKVLHVANIYFAFIELACIR